MKPRSSLLIILCCVSIYFTALGNDQIPISSAAAQNTPLNLYRVSIQSHEEAAILSQSGCEVVLRISDGYLVLATAEKVGSIAASGLTVELTAADLTRQEIAMDMRRDRANVGKHEMLFDEGGLRLYRVSLREWESKTLHDGIVPLRARYIPIVYTPQRSFAPDKMAGLVDLESLASSVRQDSLESYSYRLQAYNGRVAGSSAIQSCANWMASKFEEFGYDSVVIEVYWDSIYDEWARIRNVVAYKIGTVYPDYHVVFGAHYDAVPGSPGADDNGSGTAGVLEVARALSGVETNVTCVFALWDAEEEGLLGAWQYASRALFNHERIVSNVNMDMVAHYQNTIHGKVYSNIGDYSQMVIDLADSLTAIDLTFHLGGEGGTDYIPFEQNGFDVVNFHEYIFSSVYHSYRDSTSHLNFDYMTRMVRAAIVAGYVIGENFTPDPEVVINAPNGMPTIILPQEATEIVVAINEYGGAALVPGSPALHYSINNGSWTSISLNESGGVYSGTLPLLECGDKVEYYITIEADGLGTFYYPGANQSINACAATGVTTVFEDDFSADLGWEVSGDAVRGEWERAMSSHYSENGEPPSDFDGNRFCYLTDSNFGADVDDGATNLISPFIDCTGGHALIRYARWYSNHTGPAPNSDLFTVYIANTAGGSWHPVETVGPIVQADGGWYLHEFWVEDIITPTDQIRLRFAVSDVGDDSQVEAAVDAIEVVQYTFAPRIITESVPKWTCGFMFDQQLEAASCAGGLTWVDRYGHLAGSGLSLLSSGRLTGVPLETGLQLFVAEVTDELGESTQRMFSLFFNPELILTTSLLPGAMVNVPYSFQLTASGGTGSKVWSVAPGDLTGTGLELTPGGLLTGIPNEDGIINLTARVEDAVGASNEKLLTLAISVFHICGDANGDAGVNVGDAVFLINYVFKGGPAPNPLCAGDANGDDEVNVGDAVYLINYVFKGGPGPVEPCCP